MRFNVMWLQAVWLPAAFGVGFRYDREAPVGMPNGQVILDSDPNSCGFKVERKKAVLVCPGLLGSESKIHHPSGVPDGCFAWILESDPKKPAPRPNRRRIIRQSHFHA